MKKILGLFRPAILILLFVSVPGFAQSQGKRPPSDVLLPGREVSGQIVLDDSSPIYQTFKISVPPEAFAIRLTLSGSPGDLDIFIKHNEDIQSYDDVDRKSISSDYNEELFYSKMNVPPLRSGIYYVDVAYQLNYLPEAEGRIIRLLPFKLNYSIITLPEEQPLVVNQARTSTIKPEEGMIKVFSINVPDSAPALRVDLFDTSGDLDILIRNSAPALHKNDADFNREWVLSRESFLLRRRDEQPLQSGTYYFTVYDQVINDAPETFSIIASFQEEAPDFLQNVPPLRVPEDLLERSLLSTIEIITDSGNGSGCLVSKTGLVLTNWHVIRSHSGEPSWLIYGAASLSSLEPPVELFQLEVIAYDEDRDLALLKVRSGFYGQSLPRNYSFPYFALGSVDNLRISQPLMILGYPGIGGTGSRTSISITQGIVSGFERKHYGVIIKTDAEINGGNSGGAAINGAYELIGLPTMVVNREAGQMGFIHPVSLLPQAWRDRIDRENR
jgi:S1-C subfamily serine protease